MKINPLDHMLIEIFWLFIFSVRLVFFIILYLNNIGFFTHHNSKWKCIVMFPDHSMFEANWFFIPTMVYRCAKIDPLET